MQYTKGLVFLLSSIVSLALTASGNDSSNFSPIAQSFWGLYEPGKLLQTLDSMTADDKITQAVTSKPHNPFHSIASTTLPKLQRRIHKLEPRNAYSTEDHLNSAASQEYDYDRAYEEFVRHYFGQTAADENAEPNVEEASSSAEHDDQQFEGESLSNEEELEEPQTEASKIKSKSKEHCKKMRKNHEVCVICKNPKNGVKSETCSYSAETKPQRYSYSKKTNFKKHRSDDGDDDKEADTLSADTEVHQSVENYDDVKGKNSRNKRNKHKNSSPSSSCIKNVLGDKFCYYCEDTDGEKTTKCFDQHINAHRRKNGKDEAAAGAGGDTRKIQKTQQRIYKRTISYSYQKGGETETPIDSVENATSKAEQRPDVQESPPRLKRKVFIKVVKQQKSTLN